MDGYHYPRDPLPENDPPPPPLTKSMESAAFANRTALEELVFEANRAEREAGAAGEPWGPGPAARRMVLYGLLLLGSGVLFLYVIPSLLSIAVNLLFQLPSRSRP